MCRLLIASKNAVTDYNTRHGILKLLEHLELECGGQGAGMVFCKNKVLFGLEKGLNIPMSTFSSLMLRVNYDSVLFHTRIRSVSDKSNENCHPFVDLDNALAMNGTEDGFSALGNALGKTDTELIFDLIKGRKMKSNLKALAKLSSVFVGYANGLPFAFKNYGQLCEYKIKNGFFFSSSFPIDVKSSKLYSNFWYIDGKRSEAPKIEPAHYNYGTYNYSSYFTDIYKHNPNYSYSSPETIGESSSYNEGYEEGYEAGYEDGRTARAEIEGTSDEF